jgi:tetratricopeptide (TPR) repeat protein
MFVISSCVSTLNISSQKSFKNEDILIFSYIEDTRNKRYKEASDKLDILFSKSHKPEYIIEKLKIDILYLDKYDVSMEILDSYMQSYPEKKEFVELAFEMAMISKKYILSIKYATMILENKKTEKTYLNVANGYILSKQYDKALSYLEEAYTFTHNNMILDRMTTLMYLYENHKEKAIEYIKNHLKLYGYNEKIVQNLLAIYKEENNISGLIDVYKYLNKNSKDSEYSDILIQLYILQNKKDELVEFLMDNVIDVATFVSLYRYIDNKNDGYKIAMKLYKKTGDINFLAQAGMMEYELARQNPNSTYNIPNAIDKLTKVIKVNANSDYLNYLGYIMINHDGNLTVGIDYIKRALQSNPSSPYYLDSLAWGYYKLKKYEKAYKLIKKVVKEIGNKDDEVSIHLESIKKAIKEQEKKK